MVCVEKGALTTTTTSLDQSAWTKHEMKQDQPWKQGANECTPERNDNGVGAEERMHTGSVDSGSGG